MSDATGNLGSADLASILKREEQARHGTGIQAAELQGEWSPQKLWSKGANKSYSRQAAAMAECPPLPLRCGRGRRQSPGLQLGQLGPLGLL